MDCCHPLGLGLRVGTRVELSTEELSKREIRQVVNSRTYRWRDKERSFHNQPLSATPTACQHAATSNPSDTEAKE